MPEVESELKIKLSPADIEKVFLIFTKKDGLSQTRHKSLSRAYYDTLELGLYHKGLSLRVQPVPGGYQQTLKLELPPAGEAVLTRMECNDNISTSEPSLAAVTDPQAREAVKLFRDKSLMHIFTSAIERRFFEMKLQGGAVEVAFDVGQLVLAGGAQQQDFSEIEIELKHGSAGLIESVKQEILHLAPSAEIQPLSKSAQGSRLYLKYKK